MFNRGFFVMGERLRIANQGESWQVNSLPVARLFLGMFLLLIIAMTSSQDLNASTDKKSLTVAVASNFLAAAKHLASEYEQQTGVTIRLSSASSGKLTTQIEAGAPFDLFLSADMMRPERLVQSGHAISGSLEVYATGELVLVSRHPITTINETLSGKVAVANPITAPYGEAAKHWLAKQDSQPKLIRGENINQTWHFFELGAVEVALVAKSQVLAAEQKGNNKPLYQQPIAINSSILAQGMVVLTSSNSLNEAKAFHQYILSDSAQAYIASAGYLLSADDSGVK